MTQVLPRFFYETRTGFEHGLHIWYEGMYELFFPQVSKDGAREIVDAYKNGADWKRYAHTTKPAHYTKMRLESLEARKARDKPLTKQDVIDYIRNTYSPRTIEDCATSI